MTLSAPFGLAVPALLVMPYLQILARQVPTSPALLASFALSASTLPPTPRPVHLARQENPLESPRTPSRPRHRPTATFARQVTTPLRDLRAQSAPRASTTTKIRRMPRTTMLLPIARVAKPESRQVEPLLPRRRARAQSAPLATTPRLVLHALSAPKRSLILMRGERMRPFTLVPSPAPVAPLGHIPWSPPSPRGYPSRLSANVQLAPRAGTPQVLPF